MIRLPESKLSSGLSQMINEENFDARYYFKSTHSRLHYVLLRREIASSVYLIESGILEGYRISSSEYHYKFDFTDYINIKKQKFLDKISTDNVGSIELEFEDFSVITLGTSNTSFRINSYVDSSGYVSNISSLLAGKQSVEYTFYDRDAYFGSLWDKTQTYNIGGYIPVTRQYGRNLTYKIYRQGLTTITVNRPNAPSQIKVNLIYVPERTTRVEITTDGSTYNVYPTNDCFNDWFYWSLDGGFYTLKASGTMNKVFNVHSEILNDYKRDIEYDHIIKQNIGLGIKQDKMYDLITSPLIWDKDLNEYLIDTESFEGFNGLQVGETNLEVIFRRPRKRRRYTNRSVKFLD